MITLRNWIFGRQIRHLRARGAQSGISDYLDTAENAQIDSHSKREEFTH